MKIQINKEILDEKGKSIIEGKSTLKLIDVCISAILQPVQSDDEATKWQKYEIWKKLRDCGGAEVELLTEEISILKKAIGRHTSQLCMGQCFEMIEGKL